MPRNPAAFDARVKSCESHAGETRRGSRHRMKAIASVFFAMTLAALAACAGAYVAGDAGQHSPSVTGH